MNRRYVHLSPRLSCALDMLRDSDVVADIGCDHGRLTAALLQNGCCEHVIASDISEPSLQKAKQLLSYIGLSDRVSFRCGDGLTALKPGECEKIAMLGMGGTLMCDILSASPQITGTLVLQPMRAQSDIRKYLYCHQYRITDDRIILEHGRYYQVFRAEPDTEKQPWPDGFPVEFFDIGYQSFAQRDPNLSAYCKLQQSLYRKLIDTAVGSDGEVKLLRHMAALEQIIQNCSEY